MKNGSEEQVRLKAPQKDPSHCSYHIAVHARSRGIFSTPLKQAACSGYLGTAVAPGGALHPAKFEVTGL